MYTYNVIKINVHAKCHLTLFGNFEQKWMEFMSILRYIESMCIRQITLCYTNYRPIRTTCHALYRYAFYSKIV